MGGDSKYCLWILFYRRGGQSNVARSYGEFVTGLYNTNDEPTSATSFDASDKLFVLGNGTGDAARSNALVIFKNGNGTLAGTLTQNYDRRLKKDIVTLDGSLSSVLQLTGIHYRWNDVKPHDTESLQTGFVAQEIEAVLPELVTEDSEGYKSVNFIGVIPHLVEAIKTQQEMIDTQNETIEAQNERLAALAQKNQEMSAMLA
ncbi:MAG: tail fiber domain-containing protein [Reichenbachiella sp.]